MQKLDLIGQTFGRWVVVAPAASRKGRAYWLCRCECGTTKEVGTTTLRGGQSTSCGCYMREVMSASALARGIGGYKGYRKYRTVGDVLANTTRNGECMEWRGPKFPNGYAKVGKTEMFQSPLLHREVFAMAHGFRPSVVMHTCDNRCCINPAHLVAGTTKENSADKVEKGRQSKGENHGRSKLTELQALEIRRLVSEGQAQESVARQFGVSRRTVGMIAARKIWAHI